MRTLALALAAALPVWLAAPAAQAVCTSGIDCIRERFGTNPMPRNNRIIDRTDRLGDRNRPVNPYVARQGLRTAPGNRTIYAPTGQQSALEALQPNQLRPDATYTPGTPPGTVVNPYALGSTLQGATGPAYGAAPGTEPGVMGSDVTQQPYAPAAPATGPITGSTGGFTGGYTGSQFGATSPYAAGAGSVARRDPNIPAGAANQPYSDLPSPGINR
jgi:hypothetical protein